MVSRLHQIVMVILNKLVVVVVRFQLKTPGQDINTPSCFKDVIGINCKFTLWSQGAKKVSFTACHSGKL